MVAPHYTYLPGLDSVTKPADFPESPPVMVTFDCGSLDRLNELVTPSGWTRDYNVQMVQNFERKEPP